MDIETEISILFLIKKINILTRDLKGQITRILDEFLSRSLMFPTLLDLHDKSDYKVVFHFFFLNYMLVYASMLW